MQVTLTNITQGDVNVPPPLAGILPKGGTKTYRNVSQAAIDGARGFKAAIDRLFSMTVSNDPDVPDVAEVAPAAGGIAAGSITSTELASNAVTSAKIAAGAVTSAKTKRFVSTEQTATGGSQSIPHGLGAIPANVLIVPSGGHDGAGGAGIQFPTITQGVHTGSDVLVTVSQGAKFYVEAWI